jgi:hypothetical protein
LAQILFGEPVTTSPAYAPDLGRKGEGRAKSPPFSFWRRGNDANATRY